MEMKILNDEDYGKFKKALERTEECQRELMQLPYSEWRVMNVLLENQKLMMTTLCLLLERICLVESSVSNSSSSSFVLITTRENHDKAFASLSAEDQEALKDIFSFTKCFGKDVAISAEVGDHGGSYISGADIGDAPFEAFEKYQKAVGHDADKVFTHSENW
jgi:hypothetical protein